VRVDNTPAPFLHIPILRPQFPTSAYFGERVHHFAAMLQLLPVLTLAATLAVVATEGNRSSTTVSTTSAIASTTTTTTTTQHICTVAEPCSPASDCIAVDASYVCQCKSATVVWTAWTVMGVRATPSRRLTQAADGACTLRLARGQTCL